MHTEKIAIRQIEVDENTNLYFCFYLLYMTSYIYRHEVCGRTVLRTLSSVYRTITCSIIRTRYRGRSETRVSCQLNVVLIEKYFLNWPLTGTITYSEQEQCAFAE